MLRKPRISTWAEDVRSNLLIMASLVNGHFMAITPSRMTAQIETASRIQRSALAGARVAIVFSAGAISVGMVIYLDAEFGEVLISSSLFR